jgi:hypothetical protein
VLHALRVKGFAAAATVAEVAAVHEPVAEEHLRSLLAAEHAVFRAARGLWQLSPAGKEHHREALADDVAAAGARVDGLRQAYEPFLELNVAFKDLCGQWQLRDGEPNDHSDAEHDARAIAALVSLDGTAQPVVAEFASALARYEPYAGRLASSSMRVQAGEQSQFTGVMCGSYHDVWMELHEDLILTLGVDRTAEGSF